MQTWDLITSSLATPVSVLGLGSLVLFLKCCFLNPVAFKINHKSPWQSDRRSQTHRLFKHPDPSFTFALSSRMHQFSYCIISSYIGPSVFQCWRVSVLFQLRFCRHIIYLFIIIFLYYLLFCIHVSWMCICECVFVFFLTLLSSSEGNLVWKWQTVPSL